MPTTPEQATSRLPRAARWAAWFNAWVAGRVPLDDARDAALGDDAAHDVSGLGGAPLPLLDAWAELRGQGAQCALMTLPVPGDLVGLAGPPAFNERAVDRGEACLFVGTGLGATPTAVGRGVFWRAEPAGEPASPLQLAEAEGALRVSLAEAAAVLSDLDGARWRPEVADALTAMRGERDEPLPPGSSGRAQRAVVLAERCRTIVALGLDADAAVTAARSAQYRRTLTDLDRTARHAMVAAVNDAARMP